MKFRLIELFVLLASFVLVTFASRRLIDFGDLDNENNLNLNYYEPDDFDMIMNEYLRPVPKVQLDYASSIGLTIFSITIFMDSESFIFNLLGMALYLTIPFQIQQYFGYGYKFAWPLKFEKIQYEHGGNFVSFDRWFLAPFLWFTQAIFFIPEEDFKKLNLPEKNIFYCLFFIQLIHHFGIFDLFIFPFTGSELDKNK